MWFYDISHLTRSFFFPRMSFVKDYPGGSLSCTALQPSDSTQTLKSKFLKENILLFFQISGFFVYSLQKMSNILETETILETIN